MRKSSTFLTVGVIALALLVWLLLQNRPEGDVEPEVIAPPIAPLQPAPSQVARQDTGIRSGLVEIFDALTGEPLDVAVDLVTDSGVTSLRAGDPLTVTEIAESAQLRYEVLGATEYSVPAGERMVHEAGRWTIRIPFLARVSLRVEDAILEQLTSRSTAMIVTCPPSDEPPRDPNDASIGVLFSGGGGSSTLSGSILRGLRTGVVQVITQQACTERDTVPLIAPLAGSFVAGLSFPDGSSGFAQFEVKPGQDVTVFVPVRLRPVLEGVLLDWTGQPVANELVIVSSVLNSADFDLSPADNVSLTGIRCEDVLYRVTKKGVTTNDEGRFSVVTPIGLDYALESNALGSRAFWNTRDAGVILTDRVFVTLKLQDPAGGEFFTFTFLRPDGSPFSDAKGNIGIASDIPFIRQFGEYLLDAHGTMRRGGVLPGDLIVLYVLSDEIIGTMYATAPIPAPTSRELVITVPVEKMKPVAVSDER